MKDLVQIIRDNPGATAIIDNDYWVLRDQYENEIVHSDEIIPLGDGGYGFGPNYGGDILQALAVIVGIKIESV